MTNIAFGCSIFSADGSLLFDCDSTMLGDRYDLEEGTSSVTFQFQEVPLWTAATP